MQFDSLMSVALIVLSIQMIVFMWLWVFSTNRQKSVAQLYFESWKKLGGAVRWLVAPLLKKPK